MQMSGENRTIVSRGLATLEHSDFIGLHALLREAGLSGKEISSVRSALCWAPRTTRRTGWARRHKAAVLLLCTDPAAAEAMAKELCALNRERQNVEQDIYTQAEEMIDRMPERQRSCCWCWRAAVAPGRGGHRGQPPVGKILPAQLYDPSERQHRQRQLPQLGRL